LVTTGDGSGTCTTSTQIAAATWVYDTADRITTGSGSAYAYDALGRVTAIPGVDTPAGTGAGAITLGYYNTDAVAAVTQGGSTTSYTLDTANRRQVSTSPTDTVTRHYTDGSDNPTWVCPASNFLAGRL
jgi:hypothetical protein